MLKTARGGITHQYNIKATVITVAFFVLRAWNFQSVLTYTLVKMEDAQFQERTLYKLIAGEY